MKTHINKKNRKLINQYCKGCIHFSSSKYIEDICSIMLLYAYIETDKIQLSEFLELVKNCSCNECLVKPACKDKSCIKWDKYYANTIKPIDDEIYIQELKEQRRRNGKK